MHVYNDDLNAKSTADIKKLIVLYVIDIIICISDGFV